LSLMWPIVTSSPPGLALAGDVGKSTFPSLVKALEMITGGLASVHVDFAEVTYCDVAGLRALVRLTEANGGARGAYLHGLPPHLKAVLHILDWDSTPGLALY
jgi:ABC-type transporter Mla MlaB component